MKSTSKLHSWLFNFSDNDPLSRLLNAWRFWVVMAAVGAVLGWLAYSVAPPQYRARATVVIDFNLEDMLPGFDVRKTFHFLDRETRKAEEIAWADDTLATVAAEVVGTSITELRSGKLLLSQPAEGGWHFWARDADPTRAQELAAIWIDSFIVNMGEAVELSAEVEDARDALAEVVHFSEEPDPEEIEKLTQILIDVSESARGVSPYIGITLTQAANLPTQRSLSLSIYLFVGAMLFAMVSALFMLITTREYPTQ